MAQTEVCTICLLKVPAFISEALRTKNHDGVEDHFFKHERHCILPVLGVDVARGAEVSPYEEIRSQHQSAL